MQALEMEQLIKKGLGGDKESLISRLEQLTDWRRRLLCNFIDPKSRGQYDLFEYGTETYTKAYIENTRKIISKWFDGMATDLGIYIRSVDEAIENLLGYELRYEIILRTISTSLQMTSIDGSEVLIWGRLDNKKLMSWKIGPINGVHAYANTTHRVERLSRNGAYLLYGSDKDEIGRVVGGDPTKILSTALDSAARHATWIGDLNKRKRLIMIRLVDKKQPSLIYAMPKQSNDGDAIICFDWPCDESRIWSDGKSIEGYLWDLIFRLDHEEQHLEDFELVGGSNICYSAMELVAFTRQFLDCLSFCAEDEAIEWANRSFARFVGIANGNLPKQSSFYAGIKEIHRINEALGKLSVHARSRFENALLESVS